MLQCFEMGGGLFYLSALLLSNGQRGSDPERWSFAGQDHPPIPQGELHILMVSCFATQSVCDKTATTGT